VEGDRRAAAEEEEAVAVGNAELLIFNRESAWAQSH
jgi:hypothetical protein